MDTGVKLDRDVLAAIGRELRPMYAGVIAEGVPERFAEILRRLDARAAYSGSAKAQLNPEQRRALELLMGSEGGLTTATLRRVYGFTSDLLTDLVHLRLAKAVTGTVMRGGRTVHIARVRITDAGRRAIEG